MYQVKFCQKEATNESEVAKGIRSDFSMLTTQPNQWRSWKVKSRWRVRLMLKDLKVIISSHVWSNLSKYSTYIQLFIHNTHYYHQVIYRYDINGLSEDLNSNLCAISDMTYWWRLLLILSKIYFTWTFSTSTCSLTTYLNDMTQGTQGYVRNTPVIKPHSEQCCINYMPGIYIYIQAYTLFTSL